MTLDVEAMYSHVGWRASGSTGRSSPLRENSHRLGYTYDA